MKTILRLIMSLVMLMLVTTSAFADEQTQKDIQPADTVDRMAEDFVQVSVLFADPSDILYSCVGHVALRLECPVYDLDYVFSYEGEDVEDKMLQFFMGRLRMGLYAVPTEEYLDEYRKVGRGVRMYHLNLPPQVETRLWQQMDERVARGADLPYDYFDRGCALSTSRFLREALDTIQIEYGQWDAHSRHTIREQFGCDYLQEAPWSRWVIHCITGTVADEERAPEDKTVCPVDLRNIWLRAKIEGHPLMDNDYEVVVPFSAPLQRPFVTPFMVAWVLLILAVASLMLRTPAIDYGILALQSFLGLFMVYMVCLSTMPNNDWNWLIVPLNPLPLLTWRWRRYANWLWAAIDVVWLVGMSIYPHQLTDQANLIFVLAFVVVLIKPLRQQTKHNHTRKKTR